MAEPPAAATEAPVEAPRRRGVSRVLATWPRRIGALVGSAVLAFAVSQGVPSLWHQASQRAGLAPAPLQVAVVRDPDLITTLDSIENYEFVVDTGIAAVGPPPHGGSEIGRYPWGKGLGGVDATTTPVRLVIRGRSDTPVILDSLAVEVLRRGPPLHGTLVSYFGQGAGQPVRFFDINLDRDPPTVTFLKKGADTVLFPFSVSKSDVEVFDIAASTLKHDVRWRLHLDYTAADEQGTMTFDDHGRPFETTASADAPDWKQLGGKPPAPQRGYGWQNGKWVELEPCC